MQGFLWGIFAGLAWARGSWLVAAAICKGCKTVWPYVLKIVTIGCIYFGLSLGRTLWPQVLAGLLAGGATLMAVSLLVSRVRLR